MSTLYTKTDMLNYIKAELGSPVINVEVADSQINIVIDDAIQDFQRYNCGEGTYLDYMVFTCSANTSSYILSGYDISNVSEIYFPNGAYGINQVFSPEHILLQERGGGPGSGPLSNQQGYNVGSVGLEIADYDNAMMYLEEVRRHFEKQYIPRWRDGKQELTINPTPTVSMTGLLTVYKRENWEYLINNPLIKKLCVARTKIRWGNHIRKYNLQMPGGGTVNGDAILQEGKEEEDKTMELIRAEGTPIDFFID